MDNKEFIRKSGELQKLYAEMYKEGIEGIETGCIQMDDAFFNRFDKNKCQKKHHGEKYPTCYSIHEGGIEFICLTEEPWEVDNDTIKE